ncbi:hypothetical protein QP027_09790 [Corynebacterium breve]|uniref:Uncharacterized protein n=1 Tax=Corynebacterium breve TaxID=3049799 RepID=A0ABY8VGP5_9CORY|nr:hypothetical protein [Corynebacterium breve]WIM67384.1 hypothetical protein QP027_09790 [Corynebacterium breve]
MSSITALTGMFSFLAIFDYFEGAGLFQIAEGLSDLLGLIA